MELLLLLVLLLLPPHPQRGVVLLLGVMGLRRKWSGLLLLQLREATDTHRTRRGTLLLLLRGGRRRRQVCRWRVIPVEDGQQAPVRDGGVASGAEPTVGGTR